MTAYRVAGALGVVEEGAYFAAETASGMPLPRRWDFAPDRGIGKFTEAISRAQFPVGLELQAGRLYSGIPFDAVKWKGFTSSTDLPVGAIARPVINVADDAVNKHLVGLPIHTNPSRSFIRADELLNENNILQRHVTNDLQRLGSPQSGHGGVQNLSNDELLRFGGPQGTDPIGGFREFQRGDDLRLPGSRFNIEAGHHRLEEIADRVRAGQINPNTLIEIQIIQP
jgi:hypothetical protein